MTYFTDNEKHITFLNNNRLQPKRNDVYRHFNGGLYIIEDIAKHSVTGEDIIVFRNLKTKELFVQEKKMFMDIKKTEQGYTFRFIEHFF